MSTEFKLTEQQKHAIIIVVLLIVSIILIILVVKAMKQKQEQFHRGVGIGNGLSARLRGGMSVGLGAKKNRIQIREGFEELKQSTGGTFNLVYSQENFSMGQTGQGAAGLSAQGMIDAKSIKSHLRTKQRIIY
jgi:hypothetical protein